jgi:hypothetical protein
MNQSLWRSAPATYAISFTFDFFDSTISMNTQEFSKSHSSESQMQHAVSLERPADLNKESSEKLRVAACTTSFFSEPARMYAALTSFISLRLMGAVSSSQYSHEW